MKHLRFLLLATLILGAGWGVRLWRQSRAGATLSYVLTPSPEGVRVELSVWTPLDTLVLRPLSYDAQIPLKGKALEAFAEDGTPLPVEILPGTLPLGETMELAFTRYAIRPPGGRCRVRYLATPPVFKLGGACAPVKRYALAGEGFGCAPGSNLFLVPEEPVLSLSADCAGPHEGDLDRLKGLPVQETLDQLPQVVLLWGGGERHEVGSLHVFLSPAFSAEDRRKALDWLGSLAKALEARIGPGLPLTVVLAPPQGINPLAVSDQAPRVQVSELNPGTGVGKEALAEELALRWLGMSPEDSLGSPEPGAWFPAGFALLAAHRALHEIGEDWAGEQALVAAFTPIRNVPLLSPPSKASQDFHGYRESRRVKAPCAALLLDWELARLTGGRKSLKDLWAMANLEGDPEAAAAALAGPGIRPFFSRYLREENRLLNPFPFLTRPNPFTPLPDLEKESPQLRILMTGGTQAYLETCGCKLSQSGGVSRRQTAFLEARKDAVPVLTLDLGGFFPYATKPGDLDTLSEMEIRFYLDAMGRMGYAAAAVGIQETLHGRAFLERMLAGTASPPCLSADLDLSPAAAPYVLVQAGPLKVGLVGVTGDPHRWEGALRFDTYLSTLRRRDPGAVAEASRACRAAGAQRVFLLGAVTPELLDELLRSGAAPDLVLDAESYPLWSDVHGEIPPVWTGLYRGVPWARERMGNYGLSRLDLRFPDKPGDPPCARYSSVDLNGAVPNDPDMAKALDAFYTSLVDRPDTWGSFEPLFASDPRAQGRFAGVQACKQCHPGPYAQWRTTQHADAMRILVEQHRNFNPKCVVCHVTGMGREGGYVLSKTGHPMENVQCEVCHGAGAEHAENPSKRNIRKTPAKGVCLECHNPEHAEQFERRFHQAWDKVKH